MNRNDEFRNATRRALKLAAVYLDAHPEDAQEGLFAFVPIIGKPQVRGSLRESLVLLAREYTNATYIAKLLKEVPEDVTPVLVILQTSAKDFAMAVTRATRGEAGFVVAECT